MKLHVESTLFYHFMFSEIAIQKAPLGTRQPVILFFNFFQYIPVDNFSNKFKSFFTEVIIQKIPPLIPLKVTLFL